MNDSRANAMSETDNRGAAPETESKCTSDPNPSVSEEQEQKRNGGAPSRRDWAAFSFQHEKLKHLTTVGLVLSGGVITLFRSEMMEPEPLEMIALALTVVSSMVTLAAQVGLGNEASASIRETISGDKGARDEERPRDRFGVPMGIHWFQLEAVLLLASALGLTAAFLFTDVGILPTG